MFKLILDSKIDIFRKFASNSGKVCQICRFEKCYGLNQKSKAIFVDLNFLLQVINEGKINCFKQSKTKNSKLLTDLYKA